MYTDIRHKCKAVDCGLSKTLQQYATKFNFENKFSQSLIF
jgi:hypothetical protein